MILHRGLQRRQIASYGGILVLLLSYIRSVQAFAFFRDDAGATSRRVMTPGSGKTPASRAALVTLGETSECSHQDDETTDWISVTDTLRRRTVQSALGGIMSSLSFPLQAEAAAPMLGDVSSKSSTTTQPMLEQLGLLNSRVTENLLNPPPYGMECLDVTYPTWFTGSWSVRSTTTDVQAPCGVMLFGGNQTYNTARQEIGQAPLIYESRFILSKDRTVIADREFNVRSIAQAAMGSNSVLEIPYVTPNKLTCILAPTGSPSVLQADLFVLNRRQESISDLEFDCSEVVQQVIAPAGRSASSGSPMAAPSSRLLKQVETTSLYTYHPENDSISCRQRSATYLLPSQQDPVALQLWQASRGRAVDVRFYDVAYKKVTRRN